MEKPYVIYHSGKACLVFCVWLFVVTPLVTSVIYASADPGPRVLAVLSGVLAGLSVLAGFYVDRKSPS